VQRIKRVEVVYRNGRPPVDIVVVVTIEGIVVSAHTTAVDRESRLGFFAAVARFSGAVGLARVYSRGKSRE
jgi:hypothetical protein